MTTLPSLHSGTARAPDSPLLQQSQQPPLSPTSTLSNGAAAVKPQPYLYPVASEVKSEEPIFGEIIHGDTKFKGKVSYVPVKETEEGEGERGSTTDGEGWCVMSLFSLLSLPLSLSLSLSLIPLSPFLSLPPPPPPLSLSSHSLHCTCASNYSSTPTQLTHTHTHSSYSRPYQPHL